MCRLQIALCLLFITFTTADLDGYKIVQVITERQDQNDLLYELSRNTELYDFLNLKKLTYTPIDVMVHPDEADNFFNILRENKIEFDVKYTNAAAALENEAREVSWFDSLGMGGRTVNTSRYYEYPEILEYIDELEKKYPTRVYVRVVGKSYEGRLMKTVTITNGDRVANKNVIFVDGGMHAREWISPAEILYILEQLVENYEDNKDLLADYDWMILPVINVDGYSYSRSSFLNRMWRKTRKPYFTSTSSCYGADPNRNFGTHWNEGGASDNTCDETYAGPNAFSEPETQVLRDVLQSVKNRGKFYLTLHSYGNYLIYPWGWTSEKPDNWRDMQSVVEAGFEAIKSATGTEYTIGMTTDVLYVAAGGSDDYALDIGFPIAVTLEMPGGGITGFHPPTSSIPGFVSETWIGVRAMAKKVIEMYPKLS